MLYLCAVMENERKYALRKRIANRGVDVVEHEFCYVHEDAYVVVDASYVFNRCGHDRYFDNLIVTAAKLDFLNPSLTKEQLVDAVKYVMRIQEKSVYYSSVLVFEAEKIVDTYCKLGKPQDFLAEKLVYGEEEVQSDSYETNSSRTKFYDYRRIEWKPSVSEILTMTDSEVAERNAIFASGDKVALFRYEQKIKNQKKLAYRTKILKDARWEKIDGVVHGTRLAMDETIDGILLKSDLFEECNRKLKGALSSYMFEQSLKRLEHTAGVSHNAILNDNEGKVFQSEQTILRAGYEINGEKKIINKKRVTEKSKLSSRTVGKRWHVVEPTFNELNKLITEK